ncbi:hypothetical protein PP935_gp241 [Rhizobium phage RHph_N34]|uniref:Uncharacterized protein n=1 Tax=Rhizobium phage RHph_N34 TaxID=2509586 RepID=A0A7S5UYY4_9CAUD|nr:hypothetical protein PP935_gp241 [Rhizobium phage RHph_N34]QIG74016.1 hypothetical protein EVC06_241 [Rhizobium phage RHph_N34]
MISNIFWPTMFLLNVVGFVGIRYFLHCAKDY